VRELEQTERELLGLIKELQVQKNRLSNQLGEQLTLQAVLLV